MAHRARRLSSRRRSRWVATMSAQGLCGPLSAKAASIASLQNSKTKPDTRSKASASSRCAAKVSMRARISALTTWSCSLRKTSTHLAKKSRSPSTPTAQVARWRYSCARRMVSIPNRSGSSSPAKAPPGASSSVRPISRTFSSTLTPSVMQRCIKSRARLSCRRRNASPRSN